MNLKISRAIAAASLIHRVFGAAHFSGADSFSQGYEVLSCTASDFWAKFAEGFSSAGANTVSVVGTGPVTGQGTIAGKNAVFTTPVTISGTDVIGNAEVEGTASVTIPSGVTFFGGNGMLYDNATNVFTVGTDGLTFTSISVNVTGAIVSNAANTASGTIDSYAGDISGPASLDAASTVPVSLEGSLVLTFDTQV